ncbi:MAG: preprotein translocase subunit YajC [Desulfocapsaceae bacterium]|nr:preprotein translocase subunit YajC [Desulfocapsaceae bacterium]
MTRLVCLAAAGTILMATASTAVAADASGAAGGFASFIPLILIFVVFYFLLIRPQQKQAKKHQSYLSELKKGNKVITKGGIFGEITGLTDNVLTLEIAENIRIKVTRDAVAGPQVKEDGAKEDTKKVKGG